MTPPPARGQADASAAGSAAPAVTTKMTVVDAATLRAWPLPDPGSDKESRGRLLVVGGSAETPGALLLAGEAALRAGCGKIQLATAASASAPLAVAVPESRVLRLPESAEGELLPAASARVRDAAPEADAVLLGPGFTDVDAAVALLEAVVPDLDGPLVLDALGSAFVTHHPHGLHHLHGRAVLAVNPTELAAVLDRARDEVEQDPVAAAREVAGTTAAVVLYGGTVKIIASPEGETWRVDAGGPGLGASGSGDVQAGIVAALLARGAEPAQAAVWGAFLHGTAGDRLAADTGPAGFLARELPDRLPGMLAELAPSGGGAS